MAPAREVFRGNVPGGRGHYRGVHWGVDSVTPADRRVSIPAAYREPGEDEHTRVTLFEYVRRRMGRAPEFWGRYVNHLLPVDRRTGIVQSPDDTQALTPREVAFVQAHGCRIAPIYNGSRGRSAAAHSLTGGRRGGTLAANAAHAQCEQLDIPRRVAVYADAENWPGDVAWFRGWYDTLSAAGRRGGVYGRPVRVVENPARSDRRYGMALADFPSPNFRERARARLQQQRGLTGGEPRRVEVEEHWGDELNHAIADALVAGVLGRGVDPFTGPGRQFLVWSNEPRRVMDADADANLDGDDIPQEFVPAEPARSAGISTAVWQYLQNALYRGGNRGTVDMNLCSDAGFAAMW